ncbi:MAG: hypothetical protein LBO66_02525 [Deltaproteobacteria bacterium]|jgi:hypothetical protein|nr:hypothetical protein [Deltaproteobacteria bacterium]
MALEELTIRRQTVEWGDIEFKKAAWVAPIGSLVIVSLSANAASEHLVYGVEQVNGMFAFTDTADAVEVRYTIHDWARSQNKSSAFSQGYGSSPTLTEDALLAIYSYETILDEMSEFFDRFLREPFIVRSESQFLARDRLDAYLFDQEASVFVYLISYGEIELAYVKALAGLAGEDTIDLALLFDVHTLAMTKGKSANLYGQGEWLRIHFLSPVRVFWRVDFMSVKSYFSKITFVNLLSKAWIGTASKESYALQDLYQ